MRQISVHSVTYSRQRIDPAAAFLPLVLAVFFCCLRADAEAAPRHLYLTWQDDPSRTMTVNFQTMEPLQDPVVYYASTPENLQDPSQRSAARGSSHQISGLEDGRWIHWVELRDLEPGATYYFAAGDERSGWSRPMKFRTIPDDARPLRFVIGGDTNPMNPGIQSMLYREAARLEPQFVSIGGDLAYADGLLKNIGKWDRWFELWAENVVTPTGYQVPMVLAIGNHEVRGHYGGDPEKAPFYYGFFAQSRQRAFYSHTFGKLVAFHVLDSDHTMPIEGEQTEWLRQQLEAHKQMPYQFAMYHVPLYPSSRGFGSGGSPKAREHWGPLFDRYRLTAAFEHHDHTYKRTHPLRDGKVVEKDGTLYLGDGCFGIGPRAVDYPRRWYLARSAGVYHFWLVDVIKEGVEYRALNEKGEVFDVYPVTAKGAAEADAIFQGMEKRFQFKDPLVFGGAATAEGGLFKAGEAALVVNNFLPVPVVTRFFPSKRQEEHEQLQPPELEDAVVQVPAGATAIHPVTLHAKEPVSPKAVAPLPVAFTVHHAETGESLSRGETALHVQPTARVRSLEHPIELDGRLEEWPELPHSSHRGDHVHLEGRGVAEHRGPSDGSFALGVATHDQYLYLGIKVVDDMLVRKLPEGEQKVDLNHQDSMVILLDARPAETRARSEMGREDPVHLRLMVSPTDEARDPPVIANPEALPDGVRVVSVRSDRGYNVEVAIPDAWLDGQHQGRWESVRVNITMIDHDEPGLPEPWNRQVNLHWQPLWGTLSSHLNSGTFLRE